MRGAGVRRRGGAALRGLVLALMSVALVSADGVLLSFGLSYIEAESGRLARERREAARAAAVAAGDGLRAELSALAAREDARHWREYEYLYIPPDLVGNNLALAASPIRSLPPEGDLVEARLTLDSEGQVGSPWAALDDQQRWAALAAQNSLTVEPDEALAEKRRRLLACSVLNPTLSQFVCDTVPPPIRLQDALTQDLLWNGGLAVEFEVAQQGDLDAQARLQQTWQGQAAVDRSVREFNRANSGSYGYGGQQERRPKGEPPSDATDAGSLGVLRDQQAAGVYVGPHTPVRVPDPTEAGGEAVFYFRSVRVRPWTLKVPEPRYQGFRVDVDAALDRVRRSLASDVDPSGVRLSLCVDADADRPEADLRAPLPAPFDHVAVEASIEEIGSGPLAGPRVALYSASALIALLGTGGLWVLGSLLARRTELARRRTDFVAAVSHELKAPLAGIRALAEMLDAGLVRTDEKRGEYVSHILHESERLSRIVANVLDISRVERGARSYDLRPADPRALCRSAAAAFAGRLARDGVSFRVDVEEDLPRVVCDQDALVQSVQNLVDNAVKYAGGDGGRRPEVTLRACEAGGVVRIEVEDNGPGIDPRERRLVLEPFYRGQRHLTGSVGGAGLGLAIARHHVEAMGGRIEIVSGASGGALVRLELAPEP